MARVPGYTLTLKKNQLTTSATSVQPVSNHSQPLPFLLLPHLMYSPASHSSSAEQGPRNEGEHMNTWEKFEAS